MFKFSNILVLLSLCVLINAINLDQFIRLTQSNVNLNELSELSEMFGETRGDIELRQAEAPAAAATPAASSNLSPLISGIISAFGTAFSPFLGPFKPIADAAGPLLNSAFTNILTNALSGLVGVLKSNDLPNSGYDTYLVNVPNEGSYIILAKSQQKEKDVAPAPVENSQVNSSPTISELVSNAIRETQASQIGTKTPLTAAVIGASIKKKKPLLIPLSLLTALAGVSGLPKNQKAYSDYEIILDEN